MEIEIIKVKDNKIWYRYKCDRFACYYTSVDNFKKIFVTYRESSR